jgi:hypothetical protein
LEKYLKEDIIEKCNEEFYSQILFVKKADGTMRFCVDYRGLNLVTTGFNFPLPHVDLLLQHLGGHTYYGVCDLTQGYHQCMISEECRKIIAQRIGPLYGCIDLKKSAVRFEECT